MSANFKNIPMEPLAELDEVARQLLNLSGDRKVWLFEGGLGAGKTTLIKHLCQQLGVQNHIQSPTFSIVNEYVTEEGTSVFHFDLYRLKYVREAYDIGLDEYLDSGNYCFIEWPGVAAPLWPGDSFRLVLKQNERGQREVLVPTHTTIRSSTQ